MASMNPFRFEWGDFPAQRFNPLAKLGSLLLLSLGAQTANPITVALFAVIALVLLAGTGTFGKGIVMGLKALAADGKFLIPIGVFVGFFRIFDFGNNPFFRLGELGGAAIYLAQLTVVFLFAEAFFKSTSSWELSASTSRVARTLLGRKNIDPGLYLSLAVGFIPMCFERYGRTKEAALARGYGAKRTVKATLAILEAFMADSMRSALKTADALEIRGYSSARSYASFPFGFRDAALVAFSGAALVLSRTFPLG